MGPGAFGGRSALTTARSVFFANPRENNVTEYDPKKFYDELVAHKLIYPTAVKGTFGRSGVFEDVLNRLNDLIDREAHADHAEFVQFPPVIDRTIIEKCGFMDSFPHLMGAIFSFAGRDKQALEISSRIGKGEAWGDLLGMSEVVLAPAACYPVYPTMTGTLPEKGKLVTLTGWAFRHEPSDEPTRMQSFRVRELIRFGTPDMCLAWRDEWHVRGQALLEKLGLPVASDVAADPFFGRGGKIMADGQKAQKLKFEVLVPVISKTEPTAVCSFNYHTDHFGKPFEIRTADGEIAHSACLGFGMERCTMALFRTHGFDPEKWPKAVREQLYP